MDVIEVLNTLAEMEQGSPLCPCSLRRRPSCFLTPRNRARELPPRLVGKHGDSLAKDISLQGKVKETDVAVNDSRGKDAHKDVQRQTLPVRKSRASFSGFNHVVADIRGFPKRIASHRSKSLMLTSNSTHNESNHIYYGITLDGEKLMKESSVCHGVDLHPPSRAPNWLRRCMSTPLRNRRRTSHTASCPPTAKWTPQDSSSPPAPITGFAPPTFLDDHTSGTAARAAAAEQNEMIRCLRRLCSKERGVRRDSESGIGIETQYLERETAIARLGKS